MRLLPSTLGIDWSSWDYANDERGTSDGTYEQVAGNPSTPLDQTLQLIAFLCSLGGWRYESLVARVMTIRRTDFLLRITL